MSSGGELIPNKTSLETNNKLHLYNTSKLHVYNIYKHSQAGVITTGLDAYFHQTALPRL